MVNLLTVSDLDRAAYLCLAAAAHTNLESFIPGVGEQNRRYHQDRRERFLVARERARNEDTLLSELGLTADDCAWAVQQSPYVEDKSGWELRFREAEGALRPRVPPPTCVQIDETMVNDGSGGKAVLRAGEQVELLDPNNARLLKFLEGSGPYQVRGIVRWPCGGVSLHLEPRGAEVHAREFKIHGG